MFGSVSRVASEAQKTAFTKDWIVVVIAKTKNARLSSTFFFLFEQTKG